MKYHCYLCKETIDIEMTAIKGIDIRGIALNYAKKEIVKCPECGAAMLPECFMKQLKDGSLYHPAEVLGFFSECSNADYCFEIGNYRPSCENGLLKPNCLKLLRNQVDDLLNRLQDTKKQ